MVPVEMRDTISDPVEMLHQALESAWSEICAYYEISAEAPEMGVLLEGADLAQPEHAAVTVVVNTLGEVIESTSRFSPWYKLPARAFGLTSLRSGCSGKPTWALAPEAASQWQGVLAELAHVLRANSGLVQAVLLVDALMAEAPAEEPCLSARCRCDPPRRIRIKASVLNKAGIHCDRCCLPFLIP